MTVTQENQPGQSNGCGNGPPIHRRGVLSPVKGFMKDHLISLGKLSLKISAGTAVAIAILVSFALLAEGVVRVAYYFHGRRFIHPYLGETHKPLHQTTGVTPEGESFVFTTNNYGFRGQNIPDQKPAGARYIFTIGGSTTACNEYPHEKTWPGVLEQRLRQHLVDNQIYVFNAGMPSGTSYRSLVIFLNLLTRLSPDLVIVYEGINDRGPFYPSRARYFPEVGYGEEFLRRPSYIVHELALRTGNTFVRKLNDLLLPTPVAPQDLRYHENNYRNIAYLARGHRVPLMFMTQPVMPERGSNEAVNRSTLELGVELNVPVLNLASIMPLGSQHFLPDNVHYTKLGNLWIGDHLAKWILGQRLL
jgi:lysophospholipase L1-like esterase